MDNLESKFATHAAISAHSHNTKIPILAPAGIGMKQTVMEVPSDVK